MKNRYRIVVGIDFDPTGDEALRQAIELATAIPTAELHLAHVVVELAGAPTATRLANEQVRLARAGDRLRVHVDEWRGLWDAACTDRPMIVRPMVLHVRLGSAASGLRQVAVDVDADLIVVGTHGAQGIARLMLGSVSKRLLDIAHVPVLVARPKDHLGLERAEARPDPARPGTTEPELHAAPTYELRGTLELGPKTTHVSGGV